VDFNNVQFGEGPTFRRNTSLLSSESKSKPSKNSEEAGLLFDPEYGADMLF
jgi:hypothetical protein